jgi:subtilisin-like proprotein convertase family protein
LTLDPTFVERHMPAGAPFNSTIFTQPTIDWADRVQPQSTAVLPTYDNLAGGTYEWGNEEFYDQNITSRATFWNRQRTCANSPDGYCIEPMFRSVARFDWIMDQHARKPDNYVMGTTAPIPDNTTGGLVRNNTVPHHGVLDSLRVRVVLTHPDISQLRLELTNPAGVTITLKEAGTGSGANLNGWYPTDFTPAQPLSGLYGVNVNGVWRLRIIDTQAGGTGTFTSYTLEAWYNDTWPGTPGQYYSVQMRDLCGRYALTGDNRSALTDNVAVGMLSYKTAPEKPNQTGDILWGFDPYRYEHDQMVEAIRWVLGEHFGLPMRP